VNSASFGKVFFFQKCKIFFKEVLQTDSSGAVKQPLQAII